MLALIRQLRSVSYLATNAFGAIPQYKPSIPIIHQYIKMPARPKMDPNDPTQIYDIAKLPSEYNEFRTDFKKMHSIGSQYVAVAKNGKVYHLFDASRIPFGKMCQRIAQLVAGRHKPTYKYNEAGEGDKCIVINAQNMRFTGKKIYNKKLVYHTGYIGNLKHISYEKLIREKPEQLISWGVWKQLPKNKLRMQRLEYLDIFRTREHTYTDVLPQILPRPVNFVYNSSIYEDFKNSTDTVIYSANPLDSEQSLKDLEGKKIDINLDDDVFTPFALRDTDMKSLVGGKKKEKMMRAYKKLMKRYRRYYAKDPVIRNKAYNPERTYLVKSAKQLKQLGLQDKEPLDDDPEVEEEIVK